MNKKILFFIAFIALMSIIATTCGGGNKEKIISANDISILGEGGYYFEVVDGDYTLKSIEDKIVISIKLKLIDRYDGDGKPELGNINLIPLDKNGVAVPDLGLPFRPASSSDYEKIATLLRGKEGDVVNISFEWSYFSDEKRQKRIMDETANFELTRCDFTGNYTINISAIDDDSSTISNEDWDALLNSYENYINNYIRLVKKASSGDLSALSEYGEMLEQAEELGEKLEQAEGDLTPSQLAKFNKLQMKLINAAAEIN
ncbi:MAG: hypothetical protein Q4A56_08385 [Porphyromonadaceae bacterium]|nr:hypothetical protein [Porphyromonadaceae bacterium]